MDGQMQTWLQLLNLRATPLRHKRALVSHFGSPAAIFAANRTDLKQTKLLTAVAIAEIMQMRATESTLLTRQLALLHTLNCQYVGFTTPDFPPLLNEIASPPLGLFVRGDVRVLIRPQLAMVGSRHASPGGKKTTVAFARDLAVSGLVITSGLALGIDSHAHHGCLVGDQPTIAVMATGIERIYPPENRELYARIIARGAVVTEFPPGTAPRANHFPQRNRIISGLTLGTLVVEAGVRSGSLITARLAAEQGREVFAIPGSIHMATSRGCHALIRQGAKLVENIEDILEELPGRVAIPYDRQSPAPTGENPMPALYALLDYAPASLDELMDRSQMSAAVVSAGLLELELQGWVAQTDAGYARLPPARPELDGG